MNRENLVKKTAVSLFSLPLANNSHSSKFHLAAFARRFWFGSHGDVQ
jgi:hypothetical protein